VEEALRVGYRHLDCASFYQNEAEVGQGLQRSGLPREEVFITTKVWNDCAGFDEAQRSVRRSMEALGVDYVDLALVHWPHPGHEETYRGAVASVTELSPGTDC